MNQQTDNLILTSIRRALLLIALIIFAFKVSGQTITLDKDTPKGIYDIVPKGTVPPTDTTGCQCKDGQTPKLKVGTTQTVAAGQPAEVTQTGTDLDPVFNFKIPKGADGKSIVSTVTNSDYSLTFTYSDGTTYRTPSMQGPPGPTQCTNCTGGGTTNYPYFNILDYGANGSDNNDDTDAFQKAFRACINAGGGKVIIPAASNKWFIGNTVQVVPNSGQGQIYVDVEAYGRPGNIQWRGGSAKSVFYVQGLKTSDWYGLKVEVPSAYSKVSVIDVDSSPEAQSSSFVKFRNFYINANNTDVVGIRFGYSSSNNTGGGGADISDYTIENLWFYGTRMQGQYAVQSLGRNTLAMQIRDPFVAFAHSVFSNIGQGLASSSDRGNGSWYMYGVNTSQNLCEFRFNREGTYIVSGGRQEASDKLLDTSFGSYTMHITFDGLRVNDFKGNGNLIELNSPATLIIRGCHLHRQTDQTFTDMIIVNSAGGFGVIDIESTALRTNNVVRKNGGNWKLYMKGCTKWKQPNAVETEAWLPDIPGQIL